MQVGMEDLLEEENRRIRHFRFLVDLTIGVIYQDTALKLADARKMVDDLRKVAAVLFPEKEGTFDLILWPRFNRVVRERFGRGLTVRVH